MRLLYLVSVWLHILSAVVWVGGMFFLVLVLVPVLRRREYQGLVGQLLHLTGVRYRAVGWLCLGLLIVTGTFNLWYRGIGWSEFWHPALWSGSFGRVLAVKLSAVALILILSAIHDFVIGPGATAAWRQEPGSPAARRRRRQASWFGRLNLLLALLVVLLAVLLVRGAAW